MTHLKKNKLEKLRGIFFQFGLVIAGGITLLAFEWTSPKFAYELPPSDNIYEDGVWEYPPILPEKEIEKPKVKITQPKLITDAFKKVDDDTKIIDEKKDEIKDPVIPFKGEEWKEKVIDADPELPFIVVSNMPHYADCEDLTEDDRKKCTQDKMYQHFSKKIRVPEVIKMKGKAEYKAYVYFEVNKKGEIANVKILNNEKNKIPKELEREAYNAVQSLPQLIPGQNHGKSVSVRYSVPINFTVL
jgi:periplasmic protein TonB